MSGLSALTDGKGQYLASSGLASVHGVYNAGVYNEGVYNAPSNLNIFNLWTLGFWVKPEANPEHATIFYAGTKEGYNEIRVSTTAVSAEVPLRGKPPSELRAIIKGSDGTTIKHYGWGGWFQTGVWTHTFLQWDGTDLTARKDAVLTTTGVALTDATGTMSDAPPRAVFYGSTVAGNFATFSGTIGHFGMWDEVLTPAEMATVVSGGFSSELTLISGSYTSVANLQHYWKPGTNVSNLGQDFTTSGVALDLVKQHNMSSANVVADQP